ncbi:Retron-type reverse transcriptase [Pseudomonas sp. TCU-HL1]|nr:Retron-type reverse transcriptase [Pseudomonas sp. TCU-HL1]AOE86631.1 Retron-type reverse transcriptase [Pseudomonas sp. TCU-HL1]
MNRSVSDEALRPQGDPESAGQGLLQRAFARGNLQRAWKRVKANKGAAGVDGLDIEQTAEHLLTEWAGVRQQLLSGVYRPSPVRRVVIPKPDGGERELGIPTVTDRLIQQALLQDLQPLLDPTFSEHSYGFRPGRNAHGAILAAQRYVASGRRIVVDGRLHLSVNESKSAVVSVFGRKFLGYALWLASNDEVRRGVSTKAR